MSPSRWKASVFLLTCFVATGAYVWSTGPIVNARFGHDVPIVLDGAWRVLNGQVPNVDFHSLFGPLFFLLAGLGMVLGGPSLNALVTLNLLLFFALGAWAWAIAAPRAHVAIAACFTGFVGLMVLGAYHLGFDYTVVTYANLYNRYAYALLFILVFERGVPLRTPGGRQEAFGAASTGLILVALLFIKLPFFVVALGFIVLSALLQGRVAGWRALIVGALVVLVPMALYMRLGLGAMLGDYLLPILVRRDVVTSPSFVSDKLRPSLPQLAAVAVMAGVLLASALPAIAKRRVTVLLVAGTLAGAALNLTNYGHREIPLLAVLSLLPIEHFLRGEEGPARGARHALRAAALVALAFVADVRFVYENVRSIAYARTLKATAGPGLERIAEPPLADLLVLRADGWSNERYAAKLNEGFALLRAHTTAADRIACLSFENPFSFGLQRPPPIGDVSSWHFGYGFDHRRHFPPEEVFRDATVIMIPRERDEETVTPLLAIYGGYLWEHYDVAATSTRWLLARRR